jgi:hypothetical protein
MKTITEAVAYLVAQGKPKGMATAAMHEYCGYTEPDLLFDCHNYDAGPADLNEEHIMRCYNSFAINAVIEADGTISFDEVSQFDANGNYNKE